MGKASRSVRLDSGPDWVTPRRFRAAANGRQSEMLRRVKPVGAGHGIQSSAAFSMPQYLWQGPGRRHRPLDSEPGGNVKDAHLDGVGSGLLSALSGGSKR